MIEIEGLRQGQLETMTKEGLAVQDQCQDQDQDQDQSRPTQRFVIKTGREDRGQGKHP